MTTAVLLLGHAVLGALACVTLFLRPPWRARVLTGLCLVGAGLGVVLVVAADSLDGWRTLEPGGVGTLVGAAVATAWLTAAVLSAPGGRALTCGLIGISSSALALAVTNDWAIPALLFWLCSSLAIAALAAQERSGLWVWVVLFASDATLVAALLGNWLDVRSWALPEALDGWPFYVLLAGAALRAGVIPIGGAWGLLGRAAPAIPLLVGGAFCLLPIALGDGDPWVGAALFVVALGLAGATLLTRNPWGGVAGAAAPAIAFMLGSAVVAPGALLPAGLAAIVVAGAAAGWMASQEGAPDRSALFVALSPTLAFVAAATASVVAVGRTVRAEEVVDKVPWTLVLVLAPLALTGTLAVAVRLASALDRGPGWFARVRRGERGAMSILVTRFLLSFSVAATLMPGDWLGIESDISAWDERRTLLFGTALLLGAAGAWLAVRRAAPSAETVRTRGPAFQASPWLDSPPSTKVALRLVTGLALLLAVGAVVTVGWFTFEGLRLGFL